ncbi:MAG: hypothetical protein E2O61_12620 [Gammaproteobacteria bacterium]|nr:MAG: hypothetical protein E2O59_02865 [Gammaproteobacteria bacterium]TDJ33304.1 MAG: hypothetical protein E2O61_12620 [Gammaproteobacteria bacterium]
MKSIIIASSIVLAGALFVSASAQADGPYPLWMSQDDNSVKITDAFKLTSTIAPVTTYVSDDDTTTTTTTNTSSDDDFSFSSIYSSDDDVSQWWSNTEDYDSANLFSADRIGQRGDTGSNGSSSSASSNPITFVRGGPTTIVAGNKSGYGNIDNYNVNQNPVNNLLVGGDLNGNTVQSNTLLGVDKSVDIRDIGNTISTVISGATSSSSANQAFGGRTTNGVAKPITLNQ